MEIFKMLVQRSSGRALKNMTDDENYNFIRKNYLFKDLSSSAMLFLMKRLVERHYTQGELIFKQGNAGVSLFVVKQGQVDIFFENENKEKIQYAVLDTGHLFGEISIISSTYRTASAKALENDTTLLALSTFDIQDLKKKYPEDGLKILRAMIDTVIHNLNDTTKKLQKATIENNELQKRLEKYENKR